MWREKPTERIETYQLQTVTYGTTPAAYIATKCLQVLADENHEKFPKAAHAIKHDFYMDDLLTGAKSVETAIEMQHTIHEILGKAHFPLRKYVSNSTQFLDALEPSLKETLRSVEFSSGGSARILGLQWLPALDVFVINVKTKNIESIVLTKQVIASLTAQMYDPMGLVTPVTVRGKILLQELWKEGRGWDDPVSDEISKKFREYYAELPQLADFRVPRAYGFDKNST